MEEKGYIHFDDALLNNKYGVHFNRFLKCFFTTTYFHSTWLRCLLSPVQVPTMYPIDQDTYDKVNAYHIEFKTGALTSLRIPKIVEYYTDVEPDMVLKCIRVGNTCDWNSYEVA